MELPALQGTPTFRRTLAVYHAIGQADQDLIASEVEALMGDAEVKRDSIYVQTLAAAVRAANLSPSQSNSPWIKEVLKVLNELLTTKQISQPEVLVEASCLMRGTRIRNSSSCFLDTSLMESITRCGN